MMPFECGIRSGRGMNSSPLSYESFCVAPTINWAKHFDEIQRRGCRRVISFNSFIVCDSAKHEIGGSVLIGGVESFDRDRYQRDGRLGQLPRRERVVWMA